MSQNKLTRPSLRLVTLSSASLERGDHFSFCHPQERKIYSTIEKFNNRCFTPFSMTKCFPHPLSAAGEERVVQRSVDGVSGLRRAFRGDCPSISKIYPFFEIQLANTFTKPVKSLPAKPL